MGTQPLTIVIYFTAVLVACGREAAENPDKHIVCYYASWAYYRQGLGHYEVEDIPVHLCTHVIYAFAVLSPDTSTMMSHDPWLDVNLQNYRKVVALKEKNPDLKVLIGVGGWNDSRGTKYSKLVLSPVLRRRFASHALNFILYYGFDGIDVNWEYPGYEGDLSEKDAFTHWLRDLREVLAPRGFLLTASVAAGRQNIDRGYDIPAISELLDLIHVMTYDYHGQWEDNVRHHAPLYDEGSSINPEMNAAFSLFYWQVKGAPLHKVVLGVPFYGRTWTMNGSSSDTLPGSIAEGPGHPGMYTNSEGFLAFYECCHLVSQEGWTKVTPCDQCGPYITDGDQWLGYDDVNAVKRKAEYVLQQGIAGVMVWDVTTDDFRNICGVGQNPLLNALVDTIRPSLKEQSGSTDQDNLEANLLPAEINSNDAVSQAAGNISGMSFPTAPASNYSVGDSRSSNASASRDSKLNTSATRQRTAVQFSTLQSDTEQHSPGSSPSEFTTDDNGRQTHWLHYYTRKLFKGDSSMEGSATCSASSQCKLSSGEVKPSHVAQRIARLTDALLPFPELPYSKFSVSDGNGKENHWLYYYLGKRENQNVNKPHASKAFQGLEELDAATSSTQSTTTSTTREVTPLPFEWMAWSFFRRRESLNSHLLQ